MLLLVVDTVVDTVVHITMRITFLTYAIYYIICNLFKCMIEIDIQKLIYIQIQI